MRLPDLPEWLKVSSTYYGAAALAAAILLFGPASFIQALGVAGFVDKYRMWVGFAFLISASILAARWVEWMVRRTRSLSRQRARLHRLTPEEACILAGYVHRNTRTQYFEPMNGVVLGLEAEGVLVCAVGLVDLLDGTPYNIRLWAFDYLKAHPELLGSAKPHPTTGPS